MGPPRLRGDFPARRAAALLGAVAVGLLALAADRPPEPARAAGAGGGSAARPAPPARAGGERAGAADTVEMTNRLTFAPDTVVIRAGESVEFRNTSALVHTVTADPAKASLEASVHLPDGAEPFDSGRLEPDETFTRTFETPGRYGYFCIPHEGAKMRGTVVVKPPDEGRSTSASGVWRPRDRATGSTPR